MPTLAEYILESGGRYEPNAGTYEFTLDKVTTNNEKGFVQISGKIYADFAEHDYSVFRRPTALFVVAPELQKLYRDSEVPCPNEVDLESLEGIAARYEDFVGLTLQLRIKEGKNGYTNASFLGLATNPAGI